MKLLKNVKYVLLVLLMNFNIYAAIVSDNDGSAFITKAEYDSLKNNFQSQIDYYNTSIDNKIDSAIASYISGINIERVAIETFIGNGHSTREFVRNFKLNNTNRIGDYVEGYSAVGMEGCNNDTTYLFAICAPHQKNGCSDSDYLEIAMKIFEKNLDQIKPTKEEVSLFSFENYTGEYQYHFLSFEQIPLYFIILHISFIIFKNIYFKFYQFLFSCCKKEKNDSESPSRKYTLRNRNNTKTNQLNIKTNYQKIFESVFSISKNIEILFSKGNEDEVNNDIGISYIKGIKGLCMIFYLFGTLYFNLYNSPISQKNRSLFFNNLSHYSFSVFYFGMKYSTRILLSCSGFSLFYKMICYFDEKSEEER